MFAVRRALLAALVAASLAPAESLAQSGPGFPLYGQDKWLGSVNEFTRASFLQWFNEVTPENAGKWGSAAGTTRTAAMRWTALDQA
jgi:endo-1,4-beta-xylanase